MGYLLGVDGGNSKTYAVIVDPDGNKLGQGVSGNGNHQGIGINKAIRNIKTAIDKAIKQANIHVDDIDFTQYGLAGADRELDFKILRSGLATLPFKDWDVVCDTFEGLRAGSPTNEGVVLVCGSGTNAAGRNKHGGTIQTGGFGYLYGDGAGGKFMAQQAIRSAIRSWEYREDKTILTNIIPSYLGYKNIEEMYNDFLDNQNYNTPLGITIVLHEAANKGDKVAISILEEVGWELGIAANSVIKRLGGFDDSQIPIVLTGSVLQEGRNPYLLNSIEKTVKEENPNVKLIIPKMAPVYGSILLAMDNLNIHVDEKIMNKFVSYGGYELEKERA